MVGPVHDRAGMPRLQFLTRLESLVNVGCHFGPDDLDAETWDQLIAMALERQFVEALVEQRRTKQRETETKQNAARATTGVPPPGQTIFPAARPFT